MKTVGIIGGLSWKSSLEYYKDINAIVHRKLGGWNSAKIILYSLNFNEIDLEHATPIWKESDEKLFSAAQSLEKAGADFLLLGANTAHVLFDDIQSKIGIPIVHIADATAEKIVEAGITKIGLLGTKHTMRRDFYKKRLASHGIETVIPSEEEQDIVHSIVNAIILSGDYSTAKHKLLTIVDNLVSQGAQGVILGCTELPMVLHKKDTDVLLFDTAKIHIEKAVDMLLD